MFLTLCFCMRSFSGGWRGRSNPEEAYFNQVKRYDIALWDLIYCLNFILCFLERLLEVLEIPPSVIQASLALDWWLSHHASPWWSAGRRTIGSASRICCAARRWKGRECRHARTIFRCTRQSEEESHINEDGGMMMMTSVHVLFEILLLLLLLLLLILVHPLLLFLLPLLLLFFFFLPRLLVFFFFFLPHLLLLHLILLLLLFLFFFLLLLVLIEHLLLILHPPRLVLQQAGLVVSCVEDLSLCVLLWCCLHLLLLFIWILVCFLLLLLLHLILILLLRLIFFLLLLLLSIEHIRFLLHHRAPRLLCCKIQGWLLIACTN